MNFKITPTYSFYIAIAVILCACGSSTTDDDILAGDDSTAVVQREKNNQIQKIFSSVPAQSETMETLEAAGAKYNSSYLNPIENVSKYTSLKSRALNLGVYGMDMGVTNIFEQTQESVLYLRCTNKMSTNIGISGAFDENMSSRLDANADNKDSLLAIITDSYKKADDYLQENGQAGVSSLMVVGAWVEGMYVAIQIANVTNNETIINKIGKEGATLNDLINLLESYKADTEGTEEIITSLNEVKKIYEGIAPEKITPEQFKQVSEKITEIRTKIIQ
jgi:hypothetical protein